jgi:hypothetical protein
MYNLGIQEELYSKINNCCRVIRQNRIDIISLIERGLTKEPTADIGDIATTNIYYEERVVSAERYSPYGLYSNPPKDTMVVHFDVNGHSSNKIAFPYGQENRFKELKDGEVLTGNESTKSYIKFNADGNIEIESTAKIIIKSAGDIEIDASSANVNLKANNVTVDAAKVDLGVGGAEIARKGDAVQVDSGTHIGTITGGGTNTSI